MKNLVSRFVKDESGATAIEYGLIAAGIAIAIITVVNGLGTTLSTQVRTHLDLAEVSDGCELFKGPGLPGPLSFLQSARRNQHAAVGYSSNVQFPAFPDCSLLVTRLGQRPGPRVNRSLRELMILDTARLLLFPALMAFAAASDLFTMTISNRVSLALIAGFVALAVLGGMGLHDILCISAPAQPFWWWPLPASRWDGSAAATPRSRPAWRSGSVSTISSIICSMPRCSAGR